MFVKSFLGRHAFPRFTMQVMAKIPLGEAVRKARLGAGHTQFSLAKKLGVTDTYISQIEAGKRIPSAETMVELARELGLSDALLIEYGVPKPLREMVFRAKQKIAALGGTLTLPVFGDVVAGPPSETTEKRIEEYVVLPHVFSLTRYVLKVRGDSMAPTIQPGDLVLVETALKPVQNDIIACRINGEATLKRYVKRGTMIFLKADNPQFADIIPVSSLDDFRVEGVVLKLLERDLR